MLIELPMTAKVAPLLIAGWMTLNGLTTTLPTEPLNKAIVYISGYWQHIEDGTPTGNYKGKSPICEYPAYEWNAKIYETPSKMGIDGGRISKLWIDKEGELIVGYDRGWDVKPKTKEDEKILKEVLDKIEKQGIGK